MTDHAETHDLRDLIARPYLRGDVVSVTGDETLQQVYAKMKTFDVSQVPVMNGNNMIGLIQETDVLLAVVGNLSGFSIRAGEIMTSNFTKVPYTHDVTDLLPVFEQGRVVAVVEDRDQFPEPVSGPFLGLITPIDFLNYLRKRTGQA
jgi:cystathionine beta-synthase